MALFKILKGNSATIPTKLHEGWCYFTTDEGKFYIDIMGTEEDGLTTATRPDGRIALNANEADKLSRAAGQNGRPIYFDAQGEAQAVSSISADLINGGVLGNSDDPIYLNTSSEAGGRVIIPNMENDLAHLIQRGGTVTISGTESAYHTSNMFDCTPSFANLNLASLDDTVEILITLPPNEKLQYGNMFYIDFNGSWWRGNYAKIEAKLSTEAADDWEVMYENNNLTTSALYTKRLAHYTPSGACAIDSIKITLSDFRNSKNLRIGEIGVINFNSKGLSAGYLSRAGGTVYGDITASNFIGNASSASKLTVNAGDASTPVYFKDGVPVACENIEAGDYLPLSAGADYKLTGPLGLTEGVMYGTEIPEEMFEGQLFFVEEEGSGSGVPAGGNQGSILYKASNSDGDAVWSDNIIVVSDEGLECRETIIASSISTDYIHCNGDATINGSTYFGSDLEVVGNIEAEGEISGSKVYGAVWNDYAEYRNQREMIKPGYCVASADNGQVYKTTEKFQACDGIVSDTFGFAIGETDECKTPLAVAGRVLAYCESNRYDYHAGDTVCAGPDGKIVKMSREEIREWPDRIIGIVSEIPEYETWGTGNVLVDGRIWIKVK